MTKEVMDRLRTQGLGYVCVLNGRFVDSNLRPLPPEVEMRVQEIVTGEVKEYSPPDEAPAPVHPKLGRAEIHKLPAEFHRKGGRPKGSKNKVKVNLRPKK